MQRAADETRRRFSVHWRFTVFENALSSPLSVARERDAIRGPCAAQATKGTASKSHLATFVWELALQLVARVAEAQAPARSLRCFSSVPKTRERA